MHTLPRRSLVFVGRQSHGVLQVRHVMPVLLAPERPVNRLESRYRAVRWLRSVTARVAARLARRGAR